MDKQIFVYSHVGNSRANQEDNFFVGEGNYLSLADRENIERERKCYSVSFKREGDYCVAVSDGMGGYESGEIASLLTVKYFVAHFKEILGSIIDGEEGLRGIITKFNYEMVNVAKRKKETKNMGATLCSVVSVNESVYCINVGDSRLYQYSNGSLKQITVDNTEGQRLLDLGLLTEEEVKTFSKRKAIYKYIGKDVELIPDIYKLEGIEEGTFLLLCSDGLSDVLELEEMQDMLLKKFITTKDKGKFLVEMAVERKLGAGDNITLIIIEY